MGIKPEQKWDVVTKNRSTKQSKHSSMQGRPLAEQTYEEGTAAGNGLRISPVNIMHMYTSV